MKRKEEISSLADAYYDNNVELQDTSKEVFIRTILEMFLDTSLTIEEIDIKLNMVVESKKKKNAGKEKTVSKGKGKARVRKINNEGIATIYLLVEILCLITSVGVIIIALK